MGARHKETLHRGGEFSGYEVTATRKGLTIFGYADGCGIKPIDIPWAVIDEARRKVNEVRPIGRGG